MSHSGGYERSIYDDTAGIDPADVGREIIGIIGAVAEFWEGAFLRTPTMTRRDAEVACLKRIGQWPPSDYAPRARPLEAIPQLAA